MNIVIFSLILQFYKTRKRPFDGYSHVYGFIVDKDYIFRI